MVDTRTREKLNQEIAAKLDALAESHPNGVGRLDLRQEDRELRVELCRVEALACEVNSVQLIYHATSANVPTDWEQVASELVSVVTYLEEPLVVLEVDEDRVQIRSRAAQRDAGDGVRQYLEVLLTGNRITLYRYEKRPQRQRQQVPAVVTRNQLNRLAGDLLCRLLSGDLAAQ